MSRYITLIAPPALEPVTLDEALTQCHANAGIEDEWFASRIRAGREMVEEHTRRSLITQFWALGFRGFAPVIVDLPRSPVQKVMNIFSDDVEIDLESASINTEGSPARVILPSQPGGRLRIEYIAGYGDDGRAVPAPLKDAILLYVAYCYGNREGEKDIPKTFYDLINPYRLFVP